MATPPAPIPITIITGFLGSGKTTLLLNLLPQLKALNPDYKLALIKNEFGDLAIDSQLASSPALSSVQELLNGCICCNLIGSLGETLTSITKDYSPDRIIIETSGSAFPATLAMEINRLSSIPSPNSPNTKPYILDGVITVLDVENWKGYEDTSYTAKIQAKFTDLIVFNKWEDAGERRMDECLDRLGDLEGVEGAWVKSDRGRVEVELVFGVDGGLARNLVGDEHEGHSHGEGEECNGHDHGGGGKGHQSEVEVLSITLSSTNERAAINTAALNKLLTTAPKDEVYRIKAVLTSASPVPSSDSSTPNSTPNSTPDDSKASKYILNWAFGRWTSTPLGIDKEEHASSAGKGVVLRMTMILARYESKKWKKRIEGGGFLELDGDGVEKGKLRVERLG